MAKQLEAQVQREAIKKLGGNAWKRKVERMPENQVTAIYLRLKAEGKL